MEESNWKLWEFEHREHLTLLQRLQLLEIGVLHEKYTCSAGCASRDRNKGAVF